MQHKLYTTQIVFNANYIRRKFYTTQMFVRRIIFWRIKDSRKKNDLSKKRNILQNIFTFLSAIVCFSWADELSASLDSFPFCDSWFTASLLSLSSFSFLKDKETSLFEQSEIIFSCSSSRSFLCSKSVYFFCWKSIKITFHLIVFRHTPKWRKTNYFLGGSIYAAKN